MNRPFVPGFIKKLDKDLLLNKPDTWSTRIHLVLWYSLLFCGLLVLLFLVFPFDARDYSSAPIWSTLTGVLCFIGLIVWLIFLFRFNVFKRYGAQKRGDGLKTFLLFLVGMFAIVFPAYVPSIIESARTNRQYKTDEIIKDVNEINKKICQLEYNLLPLKWKADTLRLIDYVAPVFHTDEVGTTQSVAADIADSVAAAEVAVAVGSPEYGWTRIDTTDLRIRVQGSDSIVKLKDSIYIQYNCPDYVFVNASDANSRYDDKGSSHGINQSAWIYRNLLVHFSPVNDKGKILAALKVLLAKYRYNNPYGYTTSSSEYYNDKEHSYLEKIEQKYNTGEVNTGINNICDKKYRWDKRDLPVYLRFFFYIAFTLTILLFVFRHATVKTFFLSFLVVIILSIISGIIIAFSNGDEKSIFGFCIFYYFIFGIISFLSADTRSAVKGISLNIFTFFTPFIPLLITGYYYAIVRAAYNRDTGSAYWKQFENEDLHLLMAEIGGIILFIILIEPVFKKLYRKWYALPEN